MQPRTPRRPDDDRADAEGANHDYAAKHTLREAVEQRREDPNFNASVRRIIEEDHELLERLAK